MKVALIHPYRHHSYNTVKALANLELDLDVFYGYYNKNTVIYRNIKKYEKNKIISKFLGYSDSNIDKYVRNSWKSNTLFLLSKINPKQTNKFLKSFEQDMLKKTKEYDIYFFLQDYCNKIIEDVYSKSKFIIYDHIMPAGFEQRNILIKECEKMGFEKSYIDKFLSEEKIIKNYENIKKANIILNASQATHKIVETVIGKEKAKNRSFVVPYGVNFDFMHETEFNKYILEKQSDMKNRKVKILYVGSISLAKGINYLIDTIKGLKNDNIEFGIVGLPNKEEDELLVKELIKLKNVKYYGSIPHRQIKEIYKIYDIFIFTSIIEGFGMVTLEAMSMGLPCIVNEYCSSVIKNGFNGIIVNEISAQEYIKSIRQLTDLNLLKLMSINAYEDSKMYTWDKYIESVTKILIDNIGELK